MPKFIDLSSQRFGRWYVISRSTLDKNKNIKWLCQCDCGTVREVLGSSLRKGLSISCGCVQKEVASSKKTHGLSKTRLYKIWENMKSRCFNPKHDSYHKYGKRGVTICETWRDSFEAFRDWSVNNGYSDNLTIDRIDNDGDYCPENCRWTTVKVQARNTRLNRLITHNGETHCLAEWSELLNIPKSTLHYKLKLNNWRFKDDVR